MRWGKERVGREEYVWVIGKEGAGSSNEYANGIDRDGEDGESPTLEGASDRGTLAE